MKQQFDNNCLDIIVPIKFEMDWPTTEEIVETLRFQKKHYGITRFNLGAPSLGWKTNSTIPSITRKAGCCLTSRSRSARV